MFPRVRNSWLYIYDYEWDEIFPYEIKLDTLPHPEEILGSATILVKFYRTFSSLLSVWDNSEMLPSFLPLCSVSHIVHVKERKFLFLRWSRWIRIHTKKRGWNLFPMKSSKRRESRSGDSLLLSKLGYLELSRGIHVEV